MSAVLAIDTAGPRLQLALLRADGVVDALVEDIAHGHAEILFLRLADLLARNRLGYADLTRIVVTTGPGSFTGLRIGLSAARGLGLALGIPVLGVPSLLAVSLAATSVGSVAVLQDARRDEAYVQNFFAPGWPEAGPVLLPMAEARAGLAAGVTLLEDQVPDLGRLLRFAAEADPARFPPDASYVRGADAKPQDKARVARQGVA